MARDGQSRVEVRPGAFIWMNDADKKAFEERQTQQSEAPISLPKDAPEAASIEAPENASQPRSKARKGR